MMDGSEPAATTAATASILDMPDHRADCSGDDDDEAAPVNGTALRAAHAARTKKTVPAVYCPLIDTSEDCLFRTSPPKRDRPGKCVRFNEQTENFYVPAIVIDGPDDDEEEDEDDEFVDSNCDVVVTDAMGNAQQTSIPSGGSDALEDDLAGRLEHHVLDNGGGLPDVVLATDGEPRAESESEPSEPDPAPVANGHAEGSEGGSHRHVGKRPAEPCGPGNSDSVPVVLEAGCEPASEEDSPEAVEVDYLVEEPDSPEECDHCLLEEELVQLARSAEAATPEPAEQKNAASAGLSAQRDSPVERPDWQSLQLQVADLGAQLSAREREAVQLQGKVVALEQQAQQAVGREAAAAKLEAELGASRRESEEAKEKARRLQADLDDVRAGSEALGKKLSDKLQQDAQDCHALEALTARVAELEKQLEETRAERAALEEALAKALAEAEAEREALEEALEEAMEDTSARFQKEFEDLRTVHADREQQLLADLEWKLREVQAASKKKLEEKDRTLRELLAKVTNLEDAVGTAEKHAAAARAEADQLRGLNIEQQRALRLGTRDTEQLQVNEKVLKEEVARLRASLDREKVHIDCILERHAVELASTEREWQAKVEQVKKDTADTWQTRMHAEIIRLQTDLEQASAEDKVAALHAQAIELMGDADRVKQQLQRRLDMATAEAEAVSLKAREREAQLGRELERLQTNADRDVFELRRQLDKIDMQYQERIEGLEARHEEEVGKLRAEHERRAAAVEQGYQLQSASTRATLELVKEQMRRDSEAALRAMEEQHGGMLDEQVRAKGLLEAQVSQLSQALATAKEAGSKQEQLAVQVTTLQSELKQAASSHKEAIQKVQEELTKNVRARETELAELRKQAEEERRRLAKDAEDRAGQLQRRVDDLTTQLKGRAEDRAQIEDLRRTLVAKDAALERLRAAPRPEDAAQLQLLRDSVTEHKAVIAKLRQGQQGQAQADQLKAALAERERLLQEKEAVIKDRDAALRKSQANPRPQDAQKLDELRRLLKESNEEVALLRKKAQEAAEREAELHRLRLEAAQVKESLKQVAELKKAVGEKEEAIARLGQQLSQRQKEDSNKRIKQQANQIEELRKSLVEKESALAKTAAEVSQLQKSLSEKSKAGRAEDAVQIAALKKALAEKEKAVSEKEKALARLEAEKDKAVARCDAARDTPRPEDATRIADLQRTLAAKEEEIGRLRETSKRPGDITEMQRALLSRDDEIGRLRDAVRARHGPHESELRRQLAEREAALGRLQEENRRMQLELSSKERPSSQPLAPTSIPVAAVQPQQQQQQKQQQQQQPVPFKPPTPPQQQHQTQLLFKPQPQQQPSAQQQPQHQTQTQQLQQQTQPQSLQQPLPQKTPSAEPEERKHFNSSAGIAQAAVPATRKMPWTREPLRQATEGPGRLQRNNSIISKGSIDSKSNSANGISDASGDDSNPSTPEDSSGKDGATSEPTALGQEGANRMQPSRWLGGQRQPPQHPNQQRNPEQQKQTGRLIRRLSENVQQQQQQQQQQQRPAAPTPPRRNSAVPTTVRRETVLVSFPS